MISKLLLRSEIYNSKISQDISCERDGKTGAQCYKPDPKLYFVVDYSALFETKTLQPSNQDN